MKMMRGDEEIRRKRDFVRLRDKGKEIGKHQHNEYKYKRKKGRERNGNNKIEKNET
jgi:hypothetical protein